MDAVVDSWYVYKLVPMEEHQQLSVTNTGTASNAGAELSNVVIFDFDSYCPQDPSFWEDPVERGTWRSWACVKSQILPKATAKMSHV
jgi:hypothetical protein